MTTPTRTMTVRRIVKEPGCRTLLYGDDPRYHVIADAPESGLQINEGDIVEYEDGGVNFGWLKLSERLRSK